MSNTKKRHIATFDKTLTPEQVEAEKQKNTHLGRSLLKADKLYMEHEKKEKKR